MKLHMRYICLILSIICLAYYILCVSYAGRKSSFIWIWLLGTIFFAGLYIAGTLDAKGIIDIPQLVKNIARVVIITGFVIFAILESLIVISMKQKPDYNCEYVIVLGCQIRGDRITRSLKRRLDSAYDYACINTECKIIVSGGQGRGENKTEALAMYEYLCERGIDSDRIIMEDKSTDTNENMKYSVQYISDFSSPVGIATNNFHIFRSKLLAKGQGLTHVSGIASGSDDVLFVNYMVREAMGIVKDFVCGNY